MSDMDFDDFDNKQYLPFANGPNEVRLEAWDEYTFLIERRPTGIAGRWPPCSTSHPTAFCRSWPTRKVEKQPSEI
jgi:hypothetical protein